jgi:ParB family chromosome partitioning protein
MTLALTEPTEIPLGMLRLDPHNARTIHDIEAPADLVVSMRTLGLLQPIVVRPDTSTDDPTYTIVAGSRRYAAAQALGWAAIPAVQLTGDNNTALAASAAENMVRRPMHPVDQWRAVAELTDKGMENEEAAAALGIDSRTLRRLGWLGHMAPEVITALAAETQLPGDPTLRALAFATPERQVVAIQQATRKGSTDWTRVHALCRKERVSRTLAIFDHTQMEWDEDLFAEPGADDQFTTTNIVGFLNLQKGALAERIAASKGRLMQGHADKHGQFVVPDGWRLSWDDVPKRWKKDDPRKAIVMISEEGYRTGEIVSRMIVAVEKRERAVAAANDSPATERAPRDPITKTVQTKLALMKDAALHKAVRAVAVEWSEADNLDDLVRMLLLVFTASNVSINTSSVLYGRHGMQQFASRLLNDDGTPRALSHREMGELSADIIGHVLRFDHPATNFGTSGAAAEWIGQMVQAGAHMERCDTEEVLAGCSGDLLIELARKYGVADTGKVSDVRKRLVGALPDWKPVDFGMAGPKLGEDPDDEGEEDAEDEPQPDNDGTEPPPMAA